MALLINHPPPTPAGLPLVCVCVRSVCRQLQFEMKPLLPALSAALEIYTVLKVCHHQVAPQRCIKYVSHVLQLVTFYLGLLCNQIVQN